MDHLILEKAFQAFHFEVISVIFSYFILKLMKAMSKVWSHDNDRPALGNGLGDGGLAGEERVNC